MEPRAIVAEFENSHRFLSNFYPSNVLVDGLLYSTVEHAYQAQKTLDPKMRERIRFVDSPNKAKRIGRTIPLRPDWEDVKIQVMRDLLIKKFKNPDLRRRLLATGDAELIEGNWWNDTFWGVCRGTGQNWLGRLLMEVRATL